MASRTVAMVLLAALAACSHPKPVPMVLVVSFDTTRADALSCYGGSGAQTPNIDGLAARGVRFGMALGPAASTLVAHTTVFSGLDAHGHAVVRNGFPVPETVPLLAERLRAAGWETRAVVGSVALDAATGLARGFNDYDDDVSTKVRVRVEDPAPKVTERALESADDRAPDKPLFLFVHYYDPHMPWTDAPPSLQARFLDPKYRGPVDNSRAAMTGIARRARQGALSDADRAQARAYYLAEVAWTDQALGTLLDGLKTRGLLDDALVVLLADHGESLGEPSASEGFGHGVDVDLPNIHVPLIFAGTGRWALPQGQVVDRPVRLMDVADTVLSVVGLKTDLGEGANLTPLWSHPELASPAPPSFAEAQKPVQSPDGDAWNNLSLERSVAWNGNLLVRTPRRGDKVRLTRLADGTPLDDPAAQAEGLALLAAWDAAAPTHRDVHMSDETTAGLRALGYIDDDEETIAP